MTGPQPSPPRRPYDDERLTELLGRYAQAPLSDGDAVVVLDDVAVELEGLADAWDGELRRSLAHIVGRLPARRLLLAIARPGGELRPSDFLLWRDLHQDLRDEDVQVLPVRALPAA
jgi:hypothetical protein